MTTRSTPRKNTTLYEEKLTASKELYYETYEIGKSLGKGGFAQVYELFSKGGTQLNAVKIISKLDKQNKQDPVYLEKIRSEIKIMQVASLASDRIVRYIHNFSDSEHMYIVMDLCAQGSLNDIVKKRRILTEPEVRYYAYQMVQALLALRAQNIIHRDIKLANYFVTEGYELKLGDFGLATFNDEMFKNKKSICGTPNYIAPEVIDKKEYGFEVDLWATGVVIFTMLMGVPPFETKSCKETYERIRKCLYKFEGIHRNIRPSEEGKSFIRSILQADPKKRINISELLNHPFLSYYPIPPNLEPEAGSRQPSHQFLRKYSKPLCKTPDLIQLSTSSKENITMALERRARIKCRQKYRNLGKVEPIQLDEPVVKIEEMERVKQEPEIKNEASMLSRMETEASMKKRDLSEREECLEAKKRFKSNMEPIEQTSRQMTVTMPRQKVQGEPQEECEPASTHFWELDLIKLLLKDDELNHKNRKKIILKDKRATYPLPKVYVQQNPIIWFKINDKNGLLYRLESNLLGGLFPDGTKAVISNISQLEYSNLGQVKVETGNKSTSSVLSDQLAYLNHFFNKMDLQQKIHSKSYNPREVPFVQSYAVDKQMTIFSFSNGDLQFVFGDGFSLVSYRGQQVIVCHYGTTKETFSLPIDLKLLQESKCQQKYGLVVEWLERMEEKSLFRRAEWVAKWRWDEAPTLRRKEVGSNRPHLEGVKQGRGQREGVALR